MKKLSEFDVSFDPIKNNDEKKRGIEFWHSHLQELKILQQQNHLNLIKPYDEIKKFVKENKIVGYDDAEKEWAFLPDGIQIGENERKQLLSSMQSTKDFAQQRNQLKKIYLNETNFKHFKTIFITCVTTVDEVKDIVTCSIQNSRTKTEDIEKIKKDTDKRLSETDPKFTPIEIKDKQITDQKTGKTISLDDFEGIGELQLDPKRCVADWMIDGNYDHDFRRCKPNAAVEHEEKDKYGWQTGDAKFASRYRQDTVFGVPVKFSQQMVFRQDDAINKCTLKICSSLFEEFKWDDVWYYKNFDQFFSKLKYETMSTDFVFYYADQVLEK